MAKNMSSNLIPTNQLSKERLRELGSMGGLASAEKKKKAKSIQEAFMLLADLELNLESDSAIKSVLDKAGIVANERQIATFTQMQRAKADNKGFEVMRDSSGEKPKDTVININMESPKTEAQLLKEHFGIE